MSNASLAVSLDTSHQGLYGTLLDDSEGFRLLATLLEREAGIPLPETEKNRTLMAGRLGKVLAQHRCGSYQDFHKLLLSGAELPRRDFLSAMTTHTTQFFREPAHFRFLENELPKLLRRHRVEGRHELRAWSAAASTGEEVWTLTMVLNDILEREHSGTTLKLLATDIDPKALSHGGRALYSREDLVDVPESLLKRYFVRGTGASQGFYRVRQALRNQVTFSEFNLQTPSFPFQKGFDIIFCRNVFIYFSADRVKNILENMEQCLLPGGFLFVGHSEAIVGFRAESLRKVAAATFVKESNGIKESK